MNGFLRKWKYKREVVQEAGLFQAEAVEPCAFVKRLLSGASDFVLCDADRQKTHQLIFVRHAQDFCHFVADPVRVRDVAFVPAALIAEIGDGEEHVFDRRGIIVHGKTSVAVGDDTPRKHADGCGRGFSDGRIDHGVKLFKDFGVVHGDQARRLLVASARRGEACLHNEGKMLAGNGRRKIFSAV